MRKAMLLSYTVFIFLFSACSKSGNETPAFFNQLPASSTPYVPPAVTQSKTILVDASKDGGGWWFPQGAINSADMPHQGKALVDYLKTLGYQVHELPKGVTISWNILKSFKYIIRGAPFYNYSAQEVAAYDSFLKKPSASLLLFQDHMGNTTNDALSKHLGLAFEGSYNGTLTNFSNHAVTSGVTSLNYIAGSVIKNPGANITVLATLPNQSSTGGQAAAMGILNHPTARIFFIGDINGMEQVPQPLTANVVKWLFP
jgi:hypothetical protein